MLMSLVLNFQVFVFIIFFVATQHFFTRLDEFFNSSKAKTPSVLKPHFSSPLLNALNN